MNKHEINAYKQALEKYNPFYEVNFPITSVQLCELINGLREKHNEKVVKLAHSDLLKKIDSFSEGSISVAESTYLDDQKKPRKCYLLNKRECRILAATESKTITVLLIDYLEQLEFIFEKADKAKIKEMDRKLSKNGITWREACAIAGIKHSQLAFQYMVKRRVFVKKWCLDKQDDVWKVRPALITDGSFKYVNTQGRNNEGFRVLTKGYERLERHKDDINWRCLKYSKDPKHAAQYKQHFEKYMKDHPEEFDTFGVWLKPQW